MFKISKQFSCPNQMDICDCWGPDASLDTNIDPIDWCHIFDVVSPGRCSSPRVKSPCQYLPPWQGSTGQGFWGCGRWGLLGCLLLVNLRTVWAELKILSSAVWISAAVSTTACCQYKPGFGMAKSGRKGKDQRVISRSTWYSPARRGWSFSSS